MTVKRMLSICFITAIILTAFAFMQGRVYPQELSATTDVVKVSDTRRMALIYPQPKNYYDIVSKKYEKIDTTVKINPDPLPTREYDKYVNAGNYRATWFDAKPYDFTFRVGTHYVRFTALYNTADKNIQTKAEVKTYGIKESIVINSALAPTKYSWRISTNATTKLEKDGQLVFTDKGGAFLFRVKKPTAVSEPFVSIPVKTTYVDSVLVYDLVSLIGLTFPIELDPTITVDDTDILSGMLQGAGSGKPITGSYDSTRNGQNRIYQYTYLMVVGQDSSTSMYIYRNAFTFNTASLPDNAVIDSVKLKTVVSVITGLLANFNARLCAATFTGTDSVVTAWYTQFVGFAQSAVFTPTYLSDNLNTMTVGVTAVGDTIKWDFNQAGKDSINKIGNTRLMLISSKDISRTHPQGSELVNFEDDSPYLQIWYSEPSTTTVSRNRKLILGKPPRTESLGKLPMILNLGRP